MSCSSVSCAALGSATIGLGTRVRAAVTVVVGVVIVAGVGVAGSTAIGCTLEIWTSRARSVIGSCIVSACASNCRCKIESEVGFVALITTLSELCCNATSSFPSPSS
jgi:hypothetical protein